jgi:DNA gyrase subunit B
MGRDRNTQAILPLKGKILNVEKARIDKMLAHEEIRALITALGTGIGAEDFDASKCRYGKIIIMTDADVDGSHIRTLLMTFLFRHMRELIEIGRVYVAQPPLFKITKRKKEEYIFDERDLQRRLEEMGASSITLKGINGTSFEDVTGPRLQNLAEALSRIQDVAHALERKGMSIHEYFAAVEGDGALPTAVVSSAQTPDTPVFIRSEADMEHHIAQEEAFLGREVRVWEVGDEDSLRAEADVIVTPIYEHIELEKQAKVLLDFDIDPKHWVENETPRFRIEYDSGDHVDLASLREVLEHVRKAGQRGVDVQRYKGLGEMNPDQLWETTMDRTRRTLLRVTLTDAGEADRLFSLLMGESVEPRRQFVEQHALDVRDLDI